MSTGSNDPRARRQAKIDAAAPKERRLKPVLAVVVAIVAVLGIAGAVWLGGRGGPDESAARTHPQGATGEAGGIVLGTAGAGTPTLDIYEDFQCPACQDQHKQFGETIRSLATSGEAKVVFHLKSFLDDNLRNDSSKRSANAAACAADAGKFGEYHDAVYDHQPAQEGTGYTDADLTTFAEQAGITGDALTTWKQCERDDTYGAYVGRVEEASARDGIMATPTYRVDGKDLQIGQTTTPEQFRQMVLGRGGAATTTPGRTPAPSTAPVRTPSGTPTPSGTG